MCQHARWWGRTGWYVRKPGSRTWCFRSGSYYYLYIYLCSKCSWQHKGNEIKCVNYLSCYDRDRYSFSSFNAEAKEYRKCNKCYITWQYQSDGCCIQVSSYLSVSRYDLLWIYVSCIYNLFCTILTEHLWITGKNRCFIFKLQQDRYTVNRCICSWYFSN